MMRRCEPVVFRSSGALECQHSTWENIPGNFSAAVVLSNQEPCLTSFAECVLSCHASLYRYARSLSGEPAEADELVQETYKRALGAKRKPSSNTVAQIRPWMFTILRNIWQNERRRQSREHEVWLDDAVAPTTRESPETLMSQKLLVSEVREAVDSIPVHWREIVVMRDIEELSYNEIASILGCPIGTVMSRLARARAALRQLLTSRVPVSRGIHK
jgi:RNA polymerase sigma-70 factor (ECF subfamily)